MRINATHGIHVHDCPFPPTFCSSIGGLFKGAIDDKASTFDGEEGLDVILPLEVVVVVQLGE